jgi:hypothetical protein
MNTPTNRFSMISRKNWFRSPAARSLWLALALSTPLAASAAEVGRTFATPEEALAALVVASSAQDTNALRALFGPAVADIENPDRVQAANEFSAFAESLAQTNRIAHASADRCVIEVGAEFWPFAVPLSKADGRWFFDTEAGKDELLNRRIGKNELSTLQSVRAYVEAQRDYASKDRDGDEVLEYAQNIVSHTGMKDGLYWPPDLDGEISPLGPFMAQAQGEGYTAKSRAESEAPEPFHGYLFKILPRQGKSAPGGKYDYVINGNMIGGFALVAWPAEYGQSGIMTFIVNQQGKVFQKDLGPKTAATVKSLKAYDPDRTWTISPD